VSAAFGRISASRCQPMSKSSAHECGAEVREATCAPQLHIFSLVFIVTCRHRGLHPGHRFWRENGKSLIDAAIADYTKAISFDRDYASAYTGRAMEYEKQGRAELAISPAWSAASLMRTKAPEPNAARHGIFRKCGSLDISPCWVFEALIRPCENSRVQDRME
jgi:tetratricopeptide (TPR) repeat protein